MSGPDQLLVLRLALLGVIFLFVFATALVLREGLRTRSPGPAKAPRSVAGPRLILLGVAETGLRPGVEFALAGETTVGRDEGNGILLADPSISGRHAAFEPDREGFRIVDFGSTNGTLVDGRTVDGSGLRLRGGEQVVLGAVVLRYQL